MAPSKTVILSTLGLSMKALAVPLKNCGVDKGYCYGYYGDTWCWTVTSKHGSTYAKEGSNGYACSDYDGYSSDEYCYEPKKPSGGGETTGSSLHATGGDTSGSEDTGSWTCPSSWYTGSAPTDGEAKEWTMGTNVYRCMHNVQFAKWSNPVADDIKSYLAPLTSMQHSNCYNLAAPAGPAGENLFWGSGGWKPSDAIASWYSEIKKPGCSLPGCDNGQGHGTGHFTALAWAGVKEIGCTSNSHGLKACRYKGSDTLDCSTPNMGGCYKDNVPAPKSSFSNCKAQVQKCFNSQVDVGIVPAARLYSTGEGVYYEASSASLMVTAGVGLVATAALIIGVVMRYRRSQSATAGALLIEEGCEEQAFEDQ